MNRNQKIGLTALLGLGIAVAALNPRASVNEGKLYAMSCSTKHFVIPTTENSEYKIPGGIYNAESLMEKMYPQMVANYTRDTAGNPFAGLGLALMANMKETFVNVMDAAVEDACEGNDLSYLTAFQSLGTN